MHTSEGLHCLRLAARDAHKYVYNPSSLNVFCLTLLLLYDVDVIIGVDSPTDILALRDQLLNLDPHFVSAGIKLYFCQVRKSYWTSNNFVIHTQLLGPH